MKRIDITLQEAHLRELRDILSTSDGNESAAYILFGGSEIASDPWDKQKRLRFTSYKVIQIPDKDVISASDAHITWSTTSFVSLLKEAKNQNLIAGIVHTHPDEIDWFSKQDDKNEGELLRLAQNRNGPDTGLISLLFVGNKNIRGRLWSKQPSPDDANVVKVVGERLTFYRSDTSPVSAEIFARQALAFGDGLNHILQNLKIAVVGCGGTGSAVAMLLARLGVGKILLIDDDIVETTNLNRLHGSTLDDARQRRPKVSVVAREIDRCEIGTRVVPIRKWVGSVECRDALKSCDIIFGCTDDHDGRLFLNRFAYFYLTPTIDMGLAIEPHAKSGFKDMSGRVTVLTPGATCLVCRGVIDPITAREEALKRTDPAQFNIQKREAYVRGAENPAPAVVTFTTETACMAVNELIQGLTGFRGEDGWSWNRIRRFDHLLDRRPGAHQDPHCPICRHTDYWGRADIEPFLDRVG